MNSLLFSLAIPTGNRALSLVRTSDSPRLRSNCPGRNTKTSVKVSGSQKVLRTEWRISIEGIIQVSEMLCRSPRPAVVG
jgi:hypothetical protein